MAGVKAAKATDKVKLVSPSGEITREVNVGSKEEVSLRFDGFLPAEQQKLEAPAKPAPSATSAVGTNA